MQSSSNVLHKGTFFWLGDFFFQWKKNFLEWKKNPTCFRVLQILNYIRIFSSLFFWAKFIVYVLCSAEPAKTNDISSYFTHTPLLKSSETQNLQDLARFWNFGTSKFSGAPSARILPCKYLRKLSPRVLKCPIFFGRAFGACLRFRAQNAYGNPLVEAQKAFFSGAPSARIYPSLQYSIIVPKRKLQQGRPHLREALFS